MLQALVGGMVTRYGLDGTKNSILRVTVRLFNHWILVKKKINNKKKPCICRLTVQFSSKIVDGEPRRAPLVLKCSPKDSLRKQPTICGDKKERLINFTIV